MAQPGSIPTRAETRSRSSDARTPPEAAYSHSLPVLSEDRSSLDWSDGEYTADVTTTRGGTSVRGTASAEGQRGTTTRTGSRAGIIRHRVAVSADAT